MHKWIDEHWKQPSYVDRDGDGVPDSEEGKAPYYFNRDDADTYNLAAKLQYPPYAQFGDAEFLCRIAEKSAAKPNATKDWADPGEQSRQISTDY